ncbi:class I SAM-dependent methyltransferase [Clostridium sp. Marseille-P299]|uniref:class I SAM-dependent methyltransferase n=1 Tax=Clostridium sp. Marseille-P299 TaxID=1805477 RepID=UPI00082D306C|nr:class I SAM-dependent methyltransferase [Clostridium sp. Marseille-P299]
MIKIEKNIQDKILDIGGGGEGVISSIYGENVIAIDYRKDELDELPYACEKMVMDASEMSFEEEYFQNVTAFYSFMYIEKNKHRKVIREIYRVLKNGGNLYIWDTDILQETEGNSPYIVDLNIDANGRMIQTTFGIIKPDAMQSCDYFKELCAENGFELADIVRVENHFFQHWVKINS